MGGGQSFRAARSTQRERDAQAERKRRTSNESFDVGRLISLTSKLPAPTPCLASSCDVSTIELAGFMGVCWAQTSATGVLKDPKPEAHGKGVLEEELPGRDRAQALRE